MTGSVYLSTMIGFSMCHISELKYFWQIPLLSKPRPSTLQNQNELPWPSVQALTPTKTRLGRYSCSDKIYLPAFAVLRSHPYSQTSSACCVMIAYFWSASSILLSPSPIRFTQLFISKSNSSTLVSNACFLKSIRALILVRQSSLLSVDLNRLVTSLPSGGQDNSVRGVLKRVGTSFLNPWKFPWSN